VSGHTAPSQGTVRAGQQSPIASTSARCSLSGLPSRYAARRAPLAVRPQDGDLSPMGVSTITDPAVLAGGGAVAAGMWGNNGAVGGPTVAQRWTAVLASVLPCWSRDDKRPNGAMVGTRVERQLPGFRSFLGLASRVSPAENNVAARRSKER